MGRKALSMSVGDDRTQSLAWQLIADSFKARGKNPQAQDAFARARDARPARAPRAARCATNCCVAAPQVYLSAWRRHASPLSVSARVAAASRSRSTHRSRRRARRRTAR